MAIDWGRPIQTKGGRKARVVCTDLKDRDYLMCIAVEDPDTGNEGVHTYTGDGRYHAQQPTDSDLVNVRSRYKRGYWVVHFRDGGMAHFAVRPDPGNLSPNQIIAIIHHLDEFEEGEGLFPK